MISFFSPFILDYGIKDLQNLCASLVIQDANKEGENDVKTSLTADTISWLSFALMLECTPLVSYCVQLLNSKYLDPAFILQQKDKKSFEKVKDRLQSLITGGVILKRITYPLFNIPTEISIAILSRARGVGVTTLHSSLGSTFQTTTLGCTTYKLDWKTKKGESIRITIYDDPQIFNPV